MTALARRELADFFQSIDLLGDPYLVKAALLEFVPDLVQAYGDTAAVLAADYYDMLRDVPPSAASFRAVMATPPNVAQSQASTRWAIGPLFGGDPDPGATLARLQGATQRLVMQAGRNTISTSARRDSVRTAVARVPAGETTCKWCVMLAGRGAVYKDTIAAGEVDEFHDNCDCTFAVIRSSADYPEGYDPDHYYELYLQGFGVGRDRDDGH